MSELSQQAVDVLLTNPKVKIISFVGSTPIVEYAYETDRCDGIRRQVEEARKITS
jgi:malonate-semialdehyde dehydrogenase (acetylating)/methylmalonate-semialdehyde dehydrogenase